MAQEGSSPPRRVLIVANPISGRGRGQRAAAELVRGFESRGVAVELLLTNARGHACELLAAAGAADVVVAIGGDGTLGEVLQGLPDPSVPVGIFPCGTANVLAHALRLPADPARALEVFLGGRRQLLDVARVGGRYSHLVVGVGFDALTVQEVEARRRGPITKRVYASAALRALRRWRAVPMRVWLDGEELSERPGMVWIANTPKYADFLRFARDTRLDDGRWEVYLFPTGSKRELVSALLHGLFAHLPGGPITMRRARRVRIEAPEPVAFQVDGDLGGHTPLEFELLPEPFSILVPR